MALVVFTSISGSPGVTTATLAAGVHWPRPVVVIEADTANVGQVMTGFFRASLDAPAGMQHLTLAVTRNTLTVQTVLDPEGGIAIPVHLLPPSTLTPIPALPAGHRLWVIPGWRDLTTAQGLQTVWGRVAALAEQLHEHGIDTLVDLGRLSVHDPRTVLLDAADQVLMCATATLTDLNRLHKRLRLPDLAARLGGDRYRLLLIGAPTTPVSVADFALAVLPVASRIGFDPIGAAVFSHGNDDPRPGRNQYRRDIRRAVSDLAHRISARPVGVETAGAS